MKVLTTLFFFGRNVFIALDRLLNVLLLGSCDETLSERMERLRASGSKVGCVACKVMSAAFFFIGGDHCDYARENGRKLGVEFWHWGK